VKEEGIVLQQAACLARCNGARCDVIPYEASSVEGFRAHVEAATSSGRRHIIVSYGRKQFLQTGV
jgi:glutathione gamma-glutamylcysteinyltransferase